MAHSSNIVLPIFVFGSDGVNIYNSIADAEMNEEQQNFKEGEYALFDGAGHRLIWSSPGPIIMGRYIVISRVSEDEDAESVKEFNQRLTELFKLYSDETAQREGLAIITDSIVNQAVRIFGFTKP